MNWAKEPFKNVVITHLVPPVACRYVFFHSNIVTTGIVSGITVIYFVTMTFSCLITATETVWTTWRCGIAPVTLATIFTTNEPLILDLSDDRPLVLVKARKWKAANEQRESKCFPCESLSCISSPPRWPSACCRRCGADLAKGGTGSSAGALGRSCVRSRFKLTQLRIYQSTPHNSGGGGTGGEQRVQTETQQKQQQRCMARSKNIKPQSSCHKRLNKKAHLSVPLIPVSPWHQARSVNPYKFGQSDGGELHQQIKIKLGAACRAETASHLIYSYQSS